MLGAERGLPLPRHEMFIALAGPGTNLALAGLLSALRLLLPTDSPASIREALILFQTMPFVVVIGLAWSAKSCRASSVAALP